MWSDLHTILRGHKLLFEYLWKEKVIDVFDDGIEVKIVQLSDTPFKSHLKIGDIMYYSLSKLTFKLKY